MTALPTGIVAGNSGHISHHNIIHALLNPVDAPFGVASILTDDIGDLPAAAQAGRIFQDSTHERLLIDNALEWIDPVSGSLRVTDPTDPRYGALGNGVTDAAPAFQSALDDLEAAGGGVLLVPRAATSYRFDADVLIPSNVAVMLLGGQFISDAAAPFKFFKNKNFDVTDFVVSRDNDIHVIAVLPTTFTRDIDMDGTEGPFEGGIQFKGVDNCGIDGPVRFEGGHTGILYWGCTRMQGGGAHFYRVADCGLRIAWPETQALGGCVWSNLGDFVAEETSVQLSDGTDVPEPTVALGSSLIITQSDVQVRSFLHIDGANAGNIFEFGDGVQNVKVGTLEGIVNTTGRKANGLFANYDGARVDNIRVTMNADGECNIRSEGATDGSQIQQYLSIGSAIGWDRSGSTTNELTVLKISCDTRHAHIGSVAGYGMRALWVHDAGAINPKDISIDDLFCEGANKAGAYIANAEHVRIGRAVLYSCGQNTGEDPKQRSGLVADSLVDPLVIGELVSEDFGALTQEYGAYSNASVIIAGRTKLAGDTGQFASDNGGTIVGDFDHEATPEGAIEASPGSTCRDRTGGKHYTKSTGSGNTGWVATGTQT